MFQVLKTYVLYGRQFVSLEIISRDESLHYYGVSATKKNGEFLDILSFDSDSLSSLSKNLLKETHCYLTINTDQVLIKETELKEDTAMVTEAFPGLITDDFYYEIKRTSQKAFVAICRKNIVDEIIQSLRDIGISVLGFNIGFGVLGNIEQYLNSEKIQTSKYVIRTTDNEFQSFDEDNRLISLSYGIEGEQINSNYLMPLAGLFNYIAPSGISSNIGTRSQTLLQDFRSRVLLKKGLIAGAGMLFLSLIINALLFNGYYNELESLQEQASLVESHKAKYTQKQKEVEQKENIVNNILLSGGSKSGFYLNRIMDSQPESVQFSLFEYQPLEKSIRPDKTISYQINEIKLEGESMDKQLFNNWIQQLDRLNWVDEVSTYKYSETSARVAEFGIIIKTVVDVEK